MAMNKFFRIPFALSGDKNTVPDASQPSGSVSYADGFGPDYELDPAVDPTAKDVPRDETNQLYFDITNAIKEYQEFGVPDFITSALNGGVPFSYSRFARVKWTDGRVYESRTNSNTTDPTNATNWRVLTDNVDYLTIATTAFEPSVSDGEAVFWDASNNRFDEAIANGTSAQNVIGFADVTNGRVFVAGLYAGQLSGLTPNVPYFLSTVTPGAITTLVGSVRVGVSRNSTSLFVSIGASAGQATETVAGIVELATDAETITGTDTTRAITAAGLQAKVATETALGIVELATALESQTLTDDLRAITPAKLAAAFQGSNRSFNANGFQRLPSGLIIQWGRQSFADIGGTLTVPCTFPLAFPNNVFNIVLTPGLTGGFVAFAMVSEGSVTLSGFSGIIAESSSVSQTGGQLRFIAIGN